MRIKWVVLSTIAVTAILVVGLAGVAWYFSGRNVALAQGPQGGWGMMGRFFGWNANPSGTPVPQGQQPGFWGPMGMMGRYYGSANSGGTGNMPCAGGYATPANPGGQPITIEQAKDAVEKYVAGLGYSNLEVDEVMEFTQNFYAIVKETDTGIGAMELLVDKYSGVVGPEYGPNMMWNAKYGMHQGGAASCCTTGGTASDTMTVKPEEALSIAQRWLDTNRPGVSTESHADPFYGYYTVHTLKDGKVNGMLSVHGATGQVWYHNWHGDFIQMIGEES
jgi:hypothetical protein